MVRRVFECEHHICEYGKRAFGNDWVTRCDATDKSVAILGNMLREIQLKGIRAGAPLMDEEPTEPGCDEDKVREIIREHMRWMETDVDKKLQAIRETLELKVDKDEFEKLLDRRVTREVEDIEAKLEAI